MAYRSGVGLNTWQCAHYLLDVRSKLLGEKFMDEVVFGGSVHFMGAKETIWYMSLTAEFQHFKVQGLSTCLL